MYTFLGRVVVFLLSFVSHYCIVKVYANNSFKNISKNSAFFFKLYGGKEKSLAILLGLKVFQTLQIIYNVLDNDLNFSKYDRESGF